MTVIITEPAEWACILANLQPSPLFVSSDRQWFRTGWGAMFVFRNT